MRLKVEVKSPLNALWSLFVSSHFGWKCHMKRVENWKSREMMNFYKKKKPSFVHIWQEITFTLKKVLIYYIIFFGPKNQKICFINFYGIYISKHAFLLIVNLKKNHVFILPNLHCLYRNKPENAFPSLSLQTCWLILLNFWQNC